MNIKCRIANQRFDIQCEDKDVDAMRAAIDRVGDKLALVKNDMQVVDSQRQIATAAILIAFDLEKGYTADERVSAMPLADVNRLEKLVDDCMAKTNYPAKT